MSADRNSAGGMRPPAIIERAQAAVSCRLRSTSAAQSTAHGRGWWMRATMIRRWWPLSRLLLPFRDGLVHFVLEEEVVTLVAQGLGLLRHWQRAFLVALGGQQLRLGPHVQPV